MILDESELAALHLKEDTMLCDHRELATESEETSRREFLERSTRAAAVAALAAMVAAVALTATVFRLSIDSDRLRPWFKHAEWHYFWYVFAIALWALAVRVVPGG